MAYDGTVFVGVKIPEELHARVVQDARENDRSVSGEIRYVLRRHLETLELETREKPTGVAHG